MNVVNHALRFRTATLRQDSSDALLEAVRKLPDALGAVVAASQQELVEQLRPLLEVIESRKEWKETVTKLNQHTKRMADSIERLEQPIVTLTGKIGEISGLVTATQQAINQVLVAAEATATTLQQLQINVDGTVKSLQSASEELRRVPESVRADLSNLHETLLRSIRAYYETLGSTYVDGIRSVASAAVEEITTAATAAGGKLNEAAIGLRVAADAITPELRNAIAMGADHLRKHLEEFNDAFGQHVPKAVLDLHATLAAASTQIETARQVLEVMRDSVNGAAKHGEEWSKVNRSLQQVHPALQLVAVDLSGSASAIKASAEAHASVPPAIKQSIAALETVISNIRKPQGPSSKVRSRKSWFEKLFG